MGEVTPLPHDNEEYWGKQLEIAERKVAYASKMLAKAALNNTRQDDKS